MMEGTGKLNEDTRDEKAGRVQIGLGGKNN